MHLQTHYLIQSEFNLIWQVTLLINTHGRVLCRNVKLLSDWIQFLGGNLGQFG